MSEERDLLIELRSDLRHVREKIDHLVSSDIKQWEKLDTQGKIVEGHERTLSFLSRGFWGAVAGIGGLAVAWIKGER